ncbi:PhzF family phenazine biosynthesis protein [Sabulibacter ruber]|uniref:PhzF family phenazine biosynthesis protein n=1 Tax=Sabulibacter ruber TaxID=2811901 RepID=UPI001A97820D|nr:PhzF family phenazine biosynthesis protein [Sabulibacter ruber]
MDLPTQVEVTILNAFTDHNTGGNPAGVVLNADHLTNAQKLQIAAKLGLSETAFVSSSTVADFKLDFFTPTRQIAHCGHATIATFSYLNQLGKIKSQHSSKETIDGTRAILLEGEQAFMEQPKPSYLEINARAGEILASLSLQEEDLLAGAPIMIASSGNSFALIPVSGPQALARIIPDLALIHRISEELDLIGYYVFCTQTEEPGRDASTRMFGPRYGIEEEAATGMAAGPLAAYLYDVLHVKKQQFLIQQGHFMPTPSPSLLTANLTVTNGEIEKIMVGGKGVSTRRVSFSIE